MNPAFELLPEIIVDPSREEEAAEGIRELYRVYVFNEMQGKGFFEEEMEKENLLDLKVSVARRYVREIREKGKAQVAMPYVCKNEPCVYVLRPWQDILIPDGTVELQSSRVIFWRRWMNEAEVRAKEQDGWDPAWIEAVVQTKGKMSNWAVNEADGPVKIVGGTKYTAVTMPESESIEVVYGFVRKVDEDGVTCICRTVFSPHLTKGSNEETDFVAEHAEMDYAHGQYPFRELKRENLGPGIEETRGVPEIAGTWQSEEKNQRDMLFNRSQIETMPPMGVPKLGGLDYRLGPTAQIPVSARDMELFKPLLDFKGHPQLAIELLNYLQQRTDNYFGRVSENVPAFRVQTKQEKSFYDFACFWEEIFMMMFSLQLQYDRAKIARICGVEEEALQKLDAASVLDELDVSIEFDVRELDPDYLTKKLEILHTKILPADRGGVVDFSAMTEFELRALDPIMARKFTQNRQAASQKMYRDVEFQVMKMFQGSEAEYVENDPAAGTKLQFLQTIIGSNPKYIMAGIGDPMRQAPPQDQRFAALLQNYQQNLQQSVVQDQNKEVGRIGVKPVGASAGV